MPVLSAGHAALTRIPAAMPGNVSAAYTFFARVGAVVTVLVLPYYMLLEGAQMRRAFLSLFPPACF